MNIIGRPSLKTGFTIRGIADRVERLDEADVGPRSLESLHERALQRREEREHAIRGRRVGERVRRVDHDLPRETRAGALHDVFGDTPFDREDDQLAESGSVDK
jgi:hypothetical protein